MRHTSFTSHPAETIGLLTQRWRCTQAADREKSIAEARRIAPPPWFADASWLGTSDSYCSTPKATFECEGHHPWDLTVFETDHYDPTSGRFVRRYATNAEIFDYSNPSDYKLPYVYDTFQWPHCEAIGQSFPRPPSTASPAA